MENKPQIQRSKLWDDIYNIVSRIPKAKVCHDAHDYSSVSSLIEEMILKTPTCTATERMFLDEIREKGYFDDFQSERAARIAAETKLAELEDVIAEIAYKKNNNEYGIMRRVIRGDSKLFKAIENSIERLDIPEGSDVN